MTQDSHQDRPSTFGILPRITRISWRDLIASLLPVVLASSIAIAIALHFLKPAPPSTITISSGPDGSTYRSVAEKYRPILARNGIKLEILSSEGSLDNLRRLTDAATSGAGLAADCTAGLSVDLAGLTGRATGAFA